MEFVELLDYARIYKNEENSYYGVRDILEYYTDIYEYVSEYFENSGIKDIPYWVDIDYKFSLMIICKRLKTPYNANKSILRLLVYLAYRWRYSYNRQYR